jgi:hypothetical protein
MHGSKPVILWSVPANEGKGTSVPSIARGTSVKSPKAPVCQLCAKADPSPLALFGRPSFVDPN